MSSTTELYVAIFDDGGVYKHWGLFIDGPTDAEKILLQILGSSTRYRFEMEISNAHKSATLLEPSTCVTWTIPKSARLRTLRKMRLSTTNIRDYVLELLDVLEEKNIIDKNETNYKHNKRVIQGKQEGLM
ncbi:hypothetical protein RJZ57_004516 [Blastomyces gilchristii]